VNRKPLRAVSTVESRPGPVCIRASSGDIN